MRSFAIKTLESDLHRLDLRFASLRMRQPRLVEPLARSIEHHGQLVPLVAVAEQERWVLIDGYLRVEALRRLARDTAQVELWDCPLAQALLIVLVRVQARTWEAIEEGAVIRELITGFALSQREVARQSGRDVSWVNRRLALAKLWCQTRLLSFRGLPTPFDVARLCPSASPHRGKTGSRIRGKDHLSIVAALNDVQRLARDDIAGETGHGGSPTACCFQSLASISCLTLFCGSVWRELAVAQK